MWFYPGGAADQHVVRWMVVLVDSSGRGKLFAAIHNLMNLVLCFNPKIFVMVAVGIT